MGDGWMEEVSVKKVRERWMRWMEERWVGEWEEEEEGRLTESSVMTMSTTPFLER